jgi:hypothetical protein
MWKHVLVQGCYQLFWLFFFMYALPSLNWSRYWTTSECQLLSSGPLSAPRADYCAYRMALPQADGGLGMNSTAAGAYCSMLNTCGWPCGSADHVGDQAACAAGVLAATGRVYAPGVVPGAEKDALCPDGSACDAYTAYRVVEQYWEARLEKQHEEDFRRGDSLLFNSFIFLQVGTGGGGAG